MLCGWFTKAGCLWAHGPGCSPGEHTVLSREMRWTLSPRSVDGLVLWVSCLFLGVTGALSSLRGVQEGRDAHTPGSLCLDSWGGPLWPTCSQTSVTPARHSPPETRQEDLPCETGRLGRGACGSLLRWPHSGLGVGAVACDHSPSHHAAAAPFWGLRCPRGGWGSGGGCCDGEVWDGGPGPWVPHRGGEGVMPRGGEAGDGPGCQQAQRHAPQARCGIPVAPAQNTRWEAGLGQGTLPLRPGGQGQGAGGPLLHGFLGQSVPGHSQPRLHLCHDIAFSPVCLGPNAPHEDTRTLVSDLSSPRAALWWPICTQSPILRSWGVRLPGPLEVTILVVDTARGGVWVPQAGIQKPHGGWGVLNQGGRTDGQRGEGGRGAVSPALQ